MRDTRLAMAAPVKSKDKVKGKDKGKAPGDEGRARGGEDEPDQDLFIPQMELFDLFQVGAYGGGGGGQPGVWGGATWLNGWQLDGGRVCVRGEGGATWRNGWRLAGGQVCVWGKGGAGWLAGWLAGRRAG